MSTRKDATTPKGGKSAKKKRRLGMGLSGMIGGPVEVKPATPQKPEPSAADHSTASSAPTVTEHPPGDAEPTLARYINIQSITPNTHQPRQGIPARSLEPLVASIRSSGVMQPIVVRPANSQGVHELVAGERRWRAATAAGLTQIPAVIHDIDDRTAAEWAIIENVQREDLDAIEQADAFQQLQSEFGLTHAEIAEQVGLTRAAVTNQIRLCDLDPDTKTLVREGALSGGHGRSLLAITTPAARLQMAKEAIAGEWSVRELERRVRSSKPASPGGSTSAKPDNNRAHLDDLEQQLAAHLGTKVQISTGRTKGRGRMVIEFYDLDQFDGLLGRMGFTSS